MRKKNILKKKYIISWKNKLLNLIIILIILIIFIILIYFLRDKQKKIFLSYGNDKFKKSRIRIKKEAKSLNLFDDCIIETDKNILNDKEFKEALKNDSFKKVFESERGGGYYIWKPYIVYKHLSKLNEGDILVYCDSGCKIEYKNKNKFKDIFDDLKSNKYNMTLNIYGDNEKKWSKGDILKYHNVENNDKILNDSQLEGGRIFLIKNNKTMEIISKWWDIAKNHPKLFDDSKSVFPNKKEFESTRNDQSHISILCKLHGECIGQKLEPIIQAKRIRE